MAQATPLVFADCARIQGPDVLEKIRGMRRLRNRASDAGGFHAPLTGACGRPTLSVEEEGKLEISMKSGRTREPHLNSRLWHRSTEVILPK